MQRWKACWCTRVLSLAHAREPIRRSSEQPPTDSPVPFESNRSATTTNGEREEACLPRRFVRTRALNEKSPFSARIGRDARDALYIAGWKLSFHLKSFREGIPMNLRLYAPMPLTTILPLSSPSTSICIRIFTRISDKSVVHSQLC